MSRMFKLFTAAIFALLFMNKADAQFLEDIEHLRHPGGNRAFDIDQEINAYVQGPVDLNYLSYPDNEQPENLVPKYSQDNPKLIYDDPEDMEIEPDPEQCPATVRCPKVEPDPNFEYEMELEDPLDEQFEEDI
ncbi:hypothetical protein RCC89_18065 [Cytophagaceae bacterium ABcell3]|nr:hypothetical protein RCC89_18065 [Cytophagaceae bacterium ABcell3]